jgi:hypothetical protein
VHGHGTHHISSYVIFKVLAKVQLTLAEWLLFLWDPCPLEDIFQRLFIPLDCEFLVAKWLKNGSVKLKEVYHISPKFDLEQHTVGNWSLQHGLQWRTVGFYKRRKNLRGLELRVAVSEVRFDGIHYSTKSRTKQQDRQIGKRSVELPTPSSCYEPVIIYIIQ